MRKFLYIDKSDRNCPLLVSAKRKPSIHTIPRSGTWIIREWHERQENRPDGRIYEGGWDIPCFPEITWGRLKELQFIGEIK